MTEIKQMSAAGIERFSETILEQFDRFGAVLESEKGETASRLFEGGAATMKGREVREYLEHQGIALREAVALEEAGWGSSAAKLVGSIPQGLGRLLEATTGVMDMARQFHRDRESGDRSYSGTMKSALYSVAQIATGQACGWLAGAAIASVTTVSLAPVVFGGAAALGAQYLVGKALR
ncbi:MAG: hypothetical protein EBZ48_01530 [Proteobacteria bacterium]|nr:hypothetical protein [Pseudomonadota bacterium]